MPTTSKGLRYPASSAAPNIPQDIQNLASDVNGKLFTHAGSSTGVIAGSPAPLGEDLIIKTWYGQVITNAAGDYTLVFPGTAFPNGLLSFSMICSTGSAQPFTFTTWNHTVSSFAVRAYNLTTGTVAGSLSITAVATIVGW